VAGRDRPAVRLSEDCQLPDPEITAPNSCQVAPSNFISCICLMGAKLSALVESAMPGSSIGSFRSWMLAASGDLPLLDREIESVEDLLAVDLNVQVFDFKPQHRFHFHVDPSS
jgi:hypothetical protein